MLGAEDRHRRGGRDFFGSLLDDPSAEVSALSAGPLWLTPGP